MSDGGEAADQLVDPEPEPNTRSIEHTYEHNHTD